MSIFIVLENPKDWSLAIDGVEVISAKQYVVDQRFTLMQTAKVFNLCKSYRYQSVGYYVSLLAAARGHRVLPNISTIQDLKLSELVRIASQELEELIESALTPLKSGTFVLSVYFGRNMAARYDRLATALFNQFPAPLLRAQFRHREHWELESLRPIATDDIPAEHLEFVFNAAKQYFDRPHRPARRVESRYDLAILRGDDDVPRPSNDKAIKKFERVAESMGFDVEIIGKDDYGRLAEFDALFIRETTQVNHWTFRFSRRAQAEGLVVIDDPDSIIRCANKVYLAELLQHHRLPMPRTMIVHRGNAADVPRMLGFPFIVKQPDASFSMGVKKVSTHEEYAALLEELFPVSDLLIAQEFVPTSFDWRVGVLDQEPIFVCKYFMAPDHWQIVDRSNPADTNYGRVESWPVEAAPPDVVKLGVRAANLIGNGLYGVDVKEVRGKPMVVEVNDNPNIDAGFEDAVLQDELYHRIMRVFLRRLESRGR